MDIYAHCKTVHGRHVLVRSYVTDAPLSKGCDFKTGLITLPIDRSNIIYVTSNPVNGDTTGSFEEDFKAIKYNLISRIRSEKDQADFDHEIAATTKAYKSKNKNKNELDQLIAAQQVEDKNGNDGSYSYPSKSGSPTLMSLIELELFGAAMAQRSKDLAYDEALHILAVAALDNTQAAMDGYDHTINWSS